MIRRFPRLGNATLAVLLALLVVAIAGMLIVVVLAPGQPELGPGPIVVEEEQGKVNAAATRTGKKLAARFGDDLTILALERHRVEDYDLIGEIFPEFPRGKIGCVIVARAGDEGAVFVEDKDLRVTYEESLEAFRKRTRKLDEAIVTGFYEGLA